MDIVIQPGKLAGTVQAIPSKSQAHRLLICAAFCGEETTLVCPATNRDIEATVDCLNALGAKIQRTDTGYFVQPITTPRSRATLNCGESGSTLRFMLPIAGALGVEATFLLGGRLPQRPLSPLWEEMERMGCSLSRPTENTVLCQGRLHPGKYTIDGGVSSQYITGLMLALSLMNEASQLEITGKIESQPYIALTKEVIALFGGKPFVSPGEIEVEGDWSNGAFFLAAQSLGSGVTVSGLSQQSAQGDRAVLQLLPLLEAGTPTIAAGDIPDLIPILSVVAAANHGAVFTNIARLRLKESDRVASTIAMLCALGGKAEATEDTLTVYGTGLCGGTVDAVNDHRIAMSAAVAATVCAAPVTLLGAECVKKSYPNFWEEYSRLGGNYELYIR